MRKLSRAETALAEIYDLAGWQTDDEAREDDPSPEDATAHVNGLIRQKCREGLGVALVEEGRRGLVDQRTAQSSAWNVLRGEGKDA